MDWSAEFPGLVHGTYLNSCAHGLLPRRTRAAMERHLDRWTAAPDWEQWGTEAEGARAAFATFIGARTEDVATQANASSGISAVMNALPVPGPRRRIVTLGIDFPTAPFVAERMASRGFTHTHVEGSVRVEEWARHLADDVALACIPAVASFSGYRLDVPAFARAAHAKGVPVLVDAFQACGTYPIDVRAWDVDFLVTGVYKWLMAPAGLAYLYVKPEQQRLVPTTGGWYANADPARFDPLAGLAPDARRFQYGGPSIIACAALRESLALLQDAGLANVERRNRELVERVMSHARERKWEILTPEEPRERASIVTIRVPDLARALAACKRNGVAINTRLGGIRVSPHFYNRDADVDRLFATLDAA